MGGSRGIGATTVRLLADNGARAAVNGRDQAALEVVAAEITARQARRSGWPAMGGG
jgi:3-oxoacyl-[acyl-carrier protein] reductase